MIIAINTHFQADNHSEDYIYFLEKCFTLIVKDHPEHTFIFLSAKEEDKEFVSFKNSLSVITKPLAKHPALRKLWYDIKLPALLKKHKVELLVSADRMCSLRTRLPQYLLLNDLSFLDRPIFIPKSHLLFYKHYLPKFIKKAQQVITFSELSKNDILSRYKINKNKIALVPVAPNPVFQPVSDGDKELIKARFTEGKEYFICPTHRNMSQYLTNVLKAFSVFKKMQNSNWKLVLTGSFAMQNAGFLRSLGNYKYREDVVLTGNLPQKELALVVGASYALLNLSRWNSFDGLELEAIQSGVGIIITNNSAAEEMAGDAALYVDAGDHKSMAASMMRLYKDEKLRGSLVEKGRKISNQYNFTRSVEILWKCIGETTNHL